MNEEYIKHKIQELTPDCHEGQRDELTKWILEHMELKPEKPYGRGSI
jgi:hypothetical protein